MILTENAINKAKQIIKEREETNEIFGIFGGGSLQKQAQKVGLQDKLVIGGAPSLGLEDIDILGDTKKIINRLKDSARKDPRGERLAGMLSMHNDLQQYIDGISNDAKLEKSAPNKKALAFLKKNRAELLARLTKLLEASLEAVKDQAENTPEQFGGTLDVEALRRSLSASKNKAASAAKKSDGPRPADSAQNTSYLPSNPFDDKRRAAKARAGSGRPRDTSIGGGPSGGSRRV